MYQLLIKSDVIAVERLAHSCDRQRGLPALTIDDEEYKVLGPHHREVQVLFTVFRPTYEVGVCWWLHL
ncbi:hypothetical protein CBR_g3747 [Chara braunii]|uniref:Uncharacterized protein n=1 Tax=Chara braunii TaxID=69332 RepID=A0A388KG88_CHABU|nr:hypothetical protein CBR_g3747 [Chara braunii]|eukprot:GBG69049.1 hypothetical protein CBR_g3747 [Chara braunii]